MDPIVGMWMPNIAFIYSVGLVAIKSHLSSKQVKLWKPCMKVLFRYLIRSRWTTHWVYKKPIVFPESQRTCEETRAGNAKHCKIWYFKKNKFVCDKSIPFRQWVTKPLGFLVVIQKMSSGIFHNWGIDSCYWGEDPCCYGRVTRNMRSLEVKGRKPLNSMIFQLRNYKYFHTWIVDVLN